MKPRGSSDDRVPTAPCFGRRRMLDTAREMIALSPVVSSTCPKQWRRQRAPTIVRLQSGARGEDNASAEPSAPQTPPFITPGTLAT